MANEFNGPVSAVVNEYLERMDAFRQDTDFYRFDGLTTTLARVTQAGGVYLVHLALDNVEDPSIKDSRALNGLRTISVDVTLKHLPDALSYLTALVEATSSGNRGTQTGFLGIPENIGCYFERLDVLGKRLRDAYTDEHHKLHTGSLEDISQELLSDTHKFTHIYSENPNEGRRNSDNTIVLINDRPGEDTILKRSFREDIRYQLKHTVTGIPREIAYYAKVFDKEVLGFE
jgi:hypothetical protein